MLTSGTLAGMAVPIQTGLGSASPPSLVSQPPFDRLVVSGLRSNVFSTPRRRRRRWATAVRLTSLLILALVVLAVAVLLGLWRYASTQIDEVELPSLDQNQEPGAPQDAVAGTLNVLVVGTDSREGFTEEELRELGTEDIGTNLTDTIMLVQVAPTRKQAVIVSFPRDLRVDPPGEPGVMKINAVHAAGGADLLVQTVQDFTGVIIDHYAEINMKGFLDLTDAVGGVEVCLDEPLVDAYAGIDLPSGCQLLDGKEAVGFVRSRRVATEQFGADDFGRINKQQYFIRQTMAKVRSAGTLLNPLKVKAVIDAVGSNLTTDRDLGPREMLNLAGSLQELEPSEVATRTVPGYWSPETGFVHAYPEQAEALFQSLRDADDLPDVGTEAPEELAPADVRVLVLNGIGTEGLASDMADYLTDKGFQVVDATNADEYDPELQDLTIEYAVGEVARAKLLEEYLADVPVTLVEVPREQLPSGVDVVLTVGGAWQPAA